jgi:hypothetical protein
MLCGPPFQLFLHRLEGFHADNGFVRSCHMVFGHLADVGEALFGDEVIAVILLQDHVFPV